MVATRLLILIVALSAVLAVADEPARPDDFVDLSDVAPGIVVEMRYAGEHNFLGRPVRGYEAGVCLLTSAAAEALAAVHAELAAFGLGVKVYDCYRPQRAVDDFVRWGLDVEDTLTQREFYPTIDKANLFRDGYIAARSGHSRGSTVDLTITTIPAPSPQPWDGDALAACDLPVSERWHDGSLDMGTAFDCFSERSHTQSTEVTPAQRAHRMLLEALMEKHGFRNYDKEWWHYTLADEPHTDTYFDVSVR